MLGFLLLCFAPAAAAKATSSRQTAVAALIVDTQRRKERSANRGEERGEQTKRERKCVCVCVRVCVRKLEIKVTSLPSQSHSLLSLSLHSGREKIQ